MRTTVFLSMFLTGLAVSAEFAFTYRGRLDMTGHAAVPELPVKIAAYAEATGGQPVWSGTYTVRPNAGGLFQIQLAGAELEAVFRADTAHWLGISVNNGEEHYPRQQILTTPLATRAASAERLAKDGTVNVLDTPALSAKSVTAGDVTIAGTLKATGPSSTLSVTELGGRGNRTLSGPSVRVFADAAPEWYHFSGISAGQTLFTSEHGGLVTLMTDDNWTAPCVTWFVGAGAVPAPFSASGTVQVYHYKFGAN